MNTGSKISKKWVLLILVLIGGLFYAITIPNFVGSHASKLNAIINNLRQLDAAKMQWALEHGATNLNQVSAMTNQLTEQDLSQYIKLSPNSPKREGLVPSFAGEIYFIKRLNESPEAKLTQKIERPWPKGSVIRFSTNSGVFVEVILPDGNKLPY